MKTYEKFKVDLHHCDATGSLKVSALLKFMQECSTVQLENSEISQKNLLDNGKSYLLTRLNMSVYKPVCAYDEIEVSTWPCESRGLSFTRCYQARRDGNIVADVITVWSIYDFARGRLCRVSDFEFDIETEDALELDSPARIHIPSELNLTLAGERAVVYSDLDSNGHINNTNYPDIICDFIPDMNKKRVIMMSISYVSEALYGETLKVYTTNSDGQYYIRTLRPDGAVNCEAIVMTEDVKPIYDMRSGVSKT